MARQGRDCLYLLWPPPVLEAEHRLYPLSARAQTSCPQLAGRFPPRPAPPGRGGRAAPGPAPRGSSAAGRDLSGFPLPPK